MKTVKELRESLEKCMSDMQEASASMSGKEGEELTSLEKAHSELYESAKSLQTDLDDAVVKAEQEGKMHKSLESAKGLDSIAFTEKKVSPEAIDGFAKHRDHERLFQKFLGDGPKMMSGNELKFLAPDESKGFQAGSDGASMPLSMKLAMLGTKWAMKVGYSKEDILLATKATMVSSSDSLGGFTVPEDFRLPVLDLMPEPPRVLDRATVVPCPTGEITMPKSVQTDSNEFGGMVGNWISEGGTKPATDTTFEQVKIPAHEFAMSTQISHRLLSRSAIAMEQWVATKGRQVCMDALDTAFISGSGSGQPLGILNTAGIRTVPRGTALQVDGDDIKGLKYSLMPQHRARGTYLMEDGVLEYLDLLKDTTGRPLFSASLANMPFDRIAGYPYVSTTRMPTIGTEGDVAFVDLSEYYVAMEQDIVVKRSDDFAFTNNVATIAIFMVVGGRFVQPRVGSLLTDAL